MRHTSWFRLLLRAIGLALVAWSLPASTSLIAMLVWAAYRRLSADPLDVEIPRQLEGAVWTLLWNTGSLIQLALGLYLLLDARSFEEAFSWRPSRPTLEAMAVDS